MIATLHSSGQTRRGTSLLEVLLATVILSVALAALTQQSFVGAQAALRAELETSAALRCSSQLDVLLADRHNLLLPQSGVFADDPAWQWQTTLEPSQFAGSQRLTIHVWQEGPLAKLTTFRLARFLNESDARSSRPPAPRQGTR